MNSLSVCVITLNEERNLPRALRSVQGIADEVVVVDCGSRDSTPEIAREFGAKMITHDWPDFASQKNFAAGAASYDWILSLDADEELSPELRQSLLEWKMREPEYDVYEFARRARYLGGWIDHCGWYPNHQRRLYRRTAAQFSGIIHESLRFKGKPGRLTGDLFHYTMDSFSEHEEKVERYSTLAARQMFDAGVRRWWAGMWLAAPWSWFRSFFLRGGFLDGHRGSLIARMAGRTVRLKYRKLGQMVKQVGQLDRQ
jgi:glycosyltransferase involved in cell wall biosynthesis